MLTLVPFILIVVISGLLFIFPDKTKAILDTVRFFFGDTMGLFYLISGLTFQIGAVVLSFSRYGKIVLGKPGEKPAYSFFAWGSMMFTCGFAADVLFYPFVEWVLYAQNSHIHEFGPVEDWAGVFSLFHWSFISWSFYLLPAVALGFMLHVKKRSRQRYSEACRPIIGKHADGFCGRAIDLFALFALLASTATAFSLATPLMSSILTNLFHISVSRNLITILILLFTCAVYTFAVLKGFKGIGFLANLSIYLLFAILAIVLLFGGQLRYILESSFQNLGYLAQNFIALNTYADPGRTTNFAQDWTIYFWAYWLVWAIAIPFFIGKISRGRTVRQTILGGFLFSGGASALVFSIIGNYAMGLQTSGIRDFITSYETSGDLYSLILNIVDTLPWAPLVLVLMFLCMIGFYATSFDTISYTMACYSHRNLEEGKNPRKSIILLWCILLILLPIALVFSESSLNNIQSLSIITAFPVGIIMIIVIAGFLKEGRQYIPK